MARELGVVRDEQHRAPRAQPLDRIRDGAGARRVEVRRRLVEHDKRSVAEERAGESDALYFSRRELPATFADERPIPVGQAADETVSTRLTRGSTNPLVGR